MRQCNNNIQWYKQLKNIYRGWIYVVCSIYIMKVFIQYFMEGTDPWVSKGAKFHYIDYIPSTIHGRFIAKNHIKTWYNKKKHGDQKGRTLSSTLRWIRQILQKLTTLSHRTAFDKAFTAFSAIKCFKRKKCKTSIHKLVKA